MLNPITERQSDRFNVLPVITGFQQLAKLLSGVSKRPLEGHGIALLTDAITQPEGVLAALVNAAVTVRALSHGLLSFALRVLGSGSSRAFQALGSVYSSRSRCGNSR